MAVLDIPQLEMFLKGTCDKMNGDYPLSHEIVKGKASQHQLRALSWGLCLPTYNVSLCLNPVCY